MAEARAKHGWSQEELAAKTEGEVSVKTILALEQGRILDPRISMVERLQLALQQSFFTESQRYNANSEEIYLA